jgi:hypothetical protein
VKLKRPIILLLAASVAAIVGWKFLGLESPPKMALASLNKKLECGDNIDGVLGEITITSNDNGKTLNVSAGSKNFELKYSGYGLFEEHYTNSTGQSLTFDPEIIHSRIFGNKGGKCS